MNRTFLPFLGNVRLKEERKNRREASGRDFNNLGCEKQKIAGNGGVGNMVFFVRNKIKIGNLILTLWKSLIKNQKVNQKKQQEKQKKPIKYYSGLYERLEMLSAFQEGPVFRFFLL